MDSTSDEWELCNDDGFIYKRKKRRLDEPPPPPPPVSDPEVEERARRDRKRKALLSLKAHYQKEIDHWHFLSNGLLAMQDKTTHHKRHHDFREMESFLGSASKLVQDNQVGCDSLLDELLLQAEAQEEIIRDVSNLCDVAEALCDAQQEWVTQSLVDLPVWSSSPRELMASLCDE